MIFLSFAIMYLGAMAAGVYLCVHDFPVLGGWICMLMVAGLLCLDLETKKKESNP